MKSGNQNRFEKEAREFASIIENDAHLLAKLGLKIVLRGAVVVITNGLYDVLALAFGAGGLAYYRITDGLRPHLGYKTDFSLDFDTCDNAQREFLNLMPKLDVDYPKVLPVLKNLGLAPIGN